MKVSTKATLGFVLGILIGAPVGGFAQLPDGAGRDILNANCTSCHDAGVITEKAASREDWVATVNNMIGFGAVVDEQSIEPLVDYLFLPLISLYQIDSLCL